jgi:[1-hydroxy-2-(trimethylamino)ethyl]phosphonate dioxygenase
MHPITTQILQLFKQRGNSMYGGEAVTQLEHALQAATLAQNAGAFPSLVTAALLHDIGHILHDLPDDAPDQSIDDLHENLASGFLDQHFIDAVSEPVRLHVAAKRYLCAKDPAYLEMLSEPSIQSLALQGGPMSKEEVAEFELLPFYKDAIKLRRWDDQAKDPKIISPPIEAFVETIEACLISI